MPTAGIRAKSATCRKYESMPTKASHNAMKDDVVDKSPFSNLIILSDKPSGSKPRSMGSTINATKSLYWLKNRSRSFLNFPGGHCLLSLVRVWTPSTLLKGCIFRLNSSSPLLLPEI